MNLIGAASSAGAATMIVLSSAPASSSVCARPTTVDMRCPIATYTDTIPESLLLMIVSIAIAVLPVWRSPMISSRWPRPIGIIASIAFRPVCSGSFTGWRWTTPGALNSAGRFCSVLISPLPSSGWPSGSTMRPSSSSPTGISSSLSVRLTVSPSTTCSHGPNSTAPTLSDSRFSARPVTSCGSSSLSNAWQFSRPCTRAMPSPTESTVPTSVSSDEPASRPSMRDLRMEVISSGLICIQIFPFRPAVSASADLRSTLRVCHLTAELFKSVSNGGVEDRVADADDDAAEDVRIDLGREVDLAAGLLGDLVADLADGLLVELDRGGHSHGQELVLLLPQPVVPAPDAEDDRHPVVLDQQLEEVDERRVGAGDRAVQPVLLLGRREVGREEEHLQLARLVERVGELAELLAHQVDLVLLLRDLEQRAGVDGGDLLHGLVALLGRQRGEVELAQRLLDVPPLVGAVERLARDLLGRKHGQVGDLGADLLDRAARLGLDVAAGLLHHLLALGARFRERLLLGRLGRAAGPRDDLVRLAARVGEPLAVLAQQLVGLLAHLRGVVDRFLDRVLALVERLADARERDLGKQPEREAEDEQRPDHQADVRADEEGVCCELDHGLEEEGDQARHEPVEEARLSEGKAQPLDRGDLVTHLRLASDRLDHLAKDD